MPSRLDEEGGGQIRGQCGSGIVPGSGQQRVMAPIVIILGLYVDVTETIGAGSEARRF